MILQVDNLTKKYREKVAVENVSFTVQPGQIMAIVGPNGAGKTSILKCIAGLRKPTSGKIIINGRFAYMPETKALYDSLTVEQMIKVACSINKDISSKRAFEYIRKFNLPLNQKIGKLSQGMNTQLYLAILFSQDAELYILDEPTWGLDPLVQNAVLEEIRNLQLDNKAVLYTSHILSDVEKVADSVIFLKSGKIVEYGEIDDIKQKYVAYTANTREECNGYVLKSVAGGFVCITTRDRIPQSISPEPVSLDNIFEAIMKDTMFSKEGE
ncbi:ABC-2 type transport system ATP-binding protein [Caldicoprobacter guelmensis]|uniref:ABC transporter ATP-binding protein n=1 Tax=Caldicoprobacter guelmensis TaxID=1170224 RepID=UPI00195E1A3E|nr:ABC transporter ATP-binding protein [Caldicoprobacter guelmensis]MBM7581443.1 ABC-2 type transport system ATP-binding protein [Caldicoprobacter guelmensis]